MPELVKIHGFKELNAKLKKLPDRVAGKGIAAAARSGAAVIRRRARQNVRKKTGTLKGEVRYFKVKGTGRFKAVYAIGLKHKSPGFYGRFWEFGTSQLPAEPWLRPALEDGRAEAIEAQRKALAKVIEKEAAK